MLCLVALGVSALGPRGAGAFVAQPQAVVPLLATYVDAYQPLSHHGGLAFTCISLFLCVASANSAGQALLVGCELLVAHVVAAHEVWSAREGSWLSPTGTAWGLWDYVTRHVDWPRLD